MRWRRESRLALGLLVVAGLLSGIALQGAHGAKPGPAADELRQDQSRLSSRTHGALLALYALDSRLSATRLELERLRGRVEDLNRERQLVLRQVAIVEGNLAASRRLLGDGLRRLYEQGRPDAMAVLLGATSIDDALTRLDELEQTAHAGARAAEEARAGRERLRTLVGDLAERIQHARALQSKAGATAASLARVRSSRLAYIASLAGERRLNARQIARLDARARDVVERAQVVQRQTAPETVASLVTGRRSLTVTASGYSLAGRTATGLPVGPGVVAVDPAVIPLGTRLRIPGYGAGVAADTGRAVVGNSIDLWFPTLADALAWGRRTVTITLH